MPIIVKDFKWSQTSSTIFIRLPFKEGTARSKVDFFKTNEYLKINYAPFIFEVFFWSEVKGYEMRCVFTQQEMCLEFPKDQPAQSWDQLERSFGSFEDKQARRHEIIEKFQQSEQDNEQAQFRQFKERERDSLRASMEVEEIRRDELKKRQSQAKAEFFAAKEREPPIRVKGALEERLAKERVKMAQLPPPREGGQIYVSFNHSAVPKWESSPKVKVTRAEEDKDLAELSTSSDVAKDKDYLLTQGSDYFQSGDMDSAIKAYSHGVKMYPEDCRFLSNRAACYLKVGNHHGTLKDSTQVLTMCPGSESMVAKAHARRAAAFKALDLEEEASVEMNAALKHFFKPTADSVKNALEVE